MLKINSICPVAWRRDWGLHGPTDVIEIEVGFSEYGNEKQIKTATFRVGQECKQPGLKNIYKIISIGVDEENGKAYLGLVDATIGQHLRQYEIQDAINELQFSVFKPPLEKLIEEVPVSQNRFDKID